MSDTPKAMTDAEISQWSEAVKNIYGEYVIPRLSVHDGANILLEIDRLIALARIGVAVKPYTDALAEEKRLKQTVNDWMNEPAKQLILAENRMAPTWREYEVATQKRNEELEKLYINIPEPSP